MRFSGGLYQSNAVNRQQGRFNFGPVGILFFFSSSFKEAPTTPNNTWYLTVSSRYEGSETRVEPTATPHARAFVEQPDLCRCWTSQRWMSLLCWSGMCRTLSRIGPLKLRADWQMLEFMSHFSYRSTWDLSGSQYVILLYQNWTRSNLSTWIWSCDIASSTRRSCDEPAHIAQGHKLAIS